MHLLKRKVMDRRTALRGLGVAMGLPLLEAMIPTGAFGGKAHADGKSALAAAGLGGGASTASGKAPLRLAYVCVPNGMWMENFTPKVAGALGELPPTLQPLDKVKQDICVLSGLAADNARAKGDGPGDHARSAAAFLTGAHPFKTAGANIKLGVSIDQIAAKITGQSTKLPSLELGCDQGRKAGECDSGYSCAYVSNISWANETTPMPKLVDPAQVFERLFGASVTGDDASMVRRMAMRKSLLDMVNEDTARITKQLGPGDRQKLDEFQTSVREIERRIEQAIGNKVVTKLPPPNLMKPKGIPKDYQEHIRMMYDLLAVAFQTDITRVSSFLVANEGSGRTFNFVGVSGAHHELSHHGKNPEKVESIKKIDRFYMEQFAYFLQRLKSIKEGSSSLLDNCMIVVGSGIGDGDRHNHDDLPVLLAGRGAGTVIPGRHVKYPKDTPICNLYLSMLQRVGAKETAFGDSKGPLAQLS